MLHSSSSPHLASTFYVHILPALTFIRVIRSGINPAIQRDKKHCDSITIARLRRNQVRAQQQNARFTIGFSLIFQGKVAFLWRESCMARAFYYLRVLLCKSCIVRDLYRLGSLHRKIRIIKLWEPAYKLAPRSEHASFRTRLFSRTFISCAFIQHLRGAHES